MLSKIQSDVKAPKGQFNSYGKYRYRSAEDIVEAVKPVINSYGYYLTLNDEIVLIGNRYYVKATATLSNGQETFTASAFAREEESKKGMDGSQITGAASSYARKYALNGLFAIDDTKDADSTNTHGKKNEEDTWIGYEKLDYLFKLLETSTYDSEMREKLAIRIEDIDTLEAYEKAVQDLQNNQLGIDGIINPSQKDINQHIKKITK